MEINREHVPECLQAFFRVHPRMALAFSGGCDSAYLMYAARACGAEIVAYQVHSQFQPAFELEDALRLAAMLGAELRILKLDVLQDAQVRRNGADRCYYCKRRIFDAILRSARADGFDAVMDGTNASDDAADRPGMRALEQLQVLSPLRLCGIRKDEVRALSRAAGLFTWNKPAYACLATRVPCGREIDADALGRVERAEGSLADMGFSGMRVRLTDRGARLELPEAQMPILLEKRQDILAALERDFAEITLDLRPRREQ